MWIVTDRGFFSFVVDRKDPSQLWLRARVREDLARNFPDAEIIEKPGSDYVFRAKVSKEAVAARMAQMIMEADIQGHFKDVAIKRSAVPEHGSRSAAMYAFWTAMAALQPYAPYSKVKRSAVKTTWKGTSADRKPGNGQGSIDFHTSPYSYGGSGVGSSKGRDFDWDNRDWHGVSNPDPVIGGDSFTAVSDEEWARMTAEEQEAYLDAEEAWLRALEGTATTDEDFGAAVRAAEFSDAQAKADAYPAPRNRPGNRRQRRKAKRANRHNQFGLDRGQEAVNRQTYLDKKAAEKARRNGGN
jgi:hypothetical protein